MDDFREFFTKSNNDSKLIEGEILALAGKHPDIRRIDLLRGLWSASGHLMHDLGADTKLGCASLMGMATEKMLQEIYGLGHNPKAGDDG